MNNITKKAMLGLASVGMLAGGMVAVQSAQAAETITVTPEDSARVKTILDACNRKDPGYACSWSGVTKRTEDTPPVIVGPDNGTRKFLNCGTDGFLRETINWSRTRDASWTVGVTVGAKADIDELFASVEVSAQVSKDESVSNARTFGSAITVEVEPGQVAWIWHAAKQNVVTGTLTAVETGGQQITWILPEMTARAPHPTDGGASGVDDDVQNAAELKLCEEANAIRPQGVEPGGLLAVDAGDRG
jgi:hypothetical protein